MPVLSLKSVRVKSMARNYSIEAENGITTIRFFRDFVVDDIRSAIDNVAAENNLNELRLWDLSKGSSNLTATDLRMLAQYGQTRFLLPSTVAIVAPKALEFGLSRIYEAYREEGLVKHRVFRTEQDARDWLSSENTIQTIY